MDEERLESVIDALQAGRHGDYEVLVAEFVKAQTADALWPVLGRAHGTAFNVFERLSAWPADDVHRAMRRLMPVVGNTLAKAVEDFHRQPFGVAGCLGLR